MLASSVKIAVRLISVQAAPGAGAADHQAQGDRIALVDRLADIAEPRHLLDDPVLARGPHHVLRELVELFEISASRSGPCQISVSRSRKGESR